MADFPQHLQTLQFRAILLREYWIKVLVDFDCVSQGLVVEEICDIIRKSKVCEFHVDEVGIPRGFKPAVPKDLNDMRMLPFLTK